MSDETEWDVSAATMAKLRNLIRPIQTDLSLQQVLMEDFPRDCSNLPIAGGWGYSQADAVVVVRDQFSSTQAARNFVSLEYLIAQKIVYEELIIFQPKDARFSGIEMKLVSQYLESCNDGQHRYDVLHFMIQCWSDWHWERLRQDWEHNDYGRRPGFSKEIHAAKRSTSKIEFERTFWFDVTDVYEDAARQPRM
jgi:hypothetical protein